MNLFNFVSRFPDEASCRAHFRDIRIRKGIRCKRCGGSQHYWLQPKSMFQCKNCRFRTSLRSGTVMENSKLPFRYWFMAMHLLTSTRKSFSARELQRHIGHLRYEPIWAMLHKLRMIMGHADELRELHRWAEPDEGFFKFRPGKKDQRSRPPDRGNHRRVTVMAIAESEPVTHPAKNTEARRCKHLKLRVMPDRGRVSAGSAAGRDNLPRAKTMAHSSGAYPLLKGEPASLSLVGQDKVTPQRPLPWVHLVIGNAKRILNGTHHGVSRSYMQQYLDEFCYKLNRRHLGENRFEVIMRHALFHWNPQQKWQ